MSKTTKIIIGIAVALLLLVAIFTWGSIASGLILFNLVIMVPCMYLRCRFLINDDINDFVEDENG